jgi:hypothetical protein
MLVCTQQVHPGFGSGRAGSFIKLREAVRVFPS